MLEFMEKARNGEIIPPEVIIQFSTLFRVHVDSTLWE